MAFVLCSDAKALAGEYVAEGGNKKTLHAKSILSQVPIHHLKEVKPKFIYIAIFYIAMPFCQLNQG